MQDLINLNETEIKIKNVELKPIIWNKEEISNIIYNIEKEYKNIVYDENSIKIAKKDKAKLTKLADSLNSKKIEIKKIVTEPYSIFEKDIKELISVINNTANSIKSTIETYENKQIEIKNNNLKTHFNELLSNIKDTDVLNKLTYESIFNKKWLNLSVSEKEAKKEMDSIIGKILSNLHNINSYNEHDKLILKKLYLNSFNMELAMQELLKHKELNDITKNINNEVPSQQTPQNNEVQQVIQTPVSDNKQYKVKLELIGTQSELMSIIDYIQKSNVKMTKL